MDGREGDPGVIVDGHMHVVPAQPARAAAQIAVGARPGSAEAAQLLDIQMEQISGRRVLIEVDRRPRLQIAHAAQPVPAQDAADRGPAQPGRLPDAHSGPALAAQKQNPSTKAKSVCRGIRCGRELRSRSPARPHSRYRRTHLAPVFALTPKLAAASFSVHFSPETFLANCSRRWILSRAFW